MDEPLDFLEFDIAFEAVGPDNYRAEVLHSPVGLASTTFRLPFSPEELDNLILSLSRPGPNIAELVKDFGWRMFNAAFGGSVRDCLINSLAEAGRQNKGLRLQLRLSTAPELAELPWEFLFYPPFDSFLALLPKVTIARYLEHPEPLKPAPVELPLRVLVLVSDPGDFTRFDVEAEWQTLKTNLEELEQAGLIELERLTDPGLVGLQMKLWWGKYHIFHYIGHGYYDPASNRGVLVLTDETGQSMPTNSQQIGALLRDHGTMRLTVLQASPGSISKLNDGFESTAERLLEQGVPAVLALTYATGAEATRALVSTIYNAVAGGQPLDQALGQARALVYARGNDFEWGSTQLYLGSPDGRVFEVASLSHEQRAGALYREAQAALTRQDWDTAIEKLEKAQTFDPTNAEIEPQLNEARRQQRFTMLYRRGRELYDSQKWGEALTTLKELQAQAGTYKDVSLLINRTTAGYRRQRLTDLEQAAQVDLLQQNWPEAVAKLEQLIELDPTRASGPAGDLLNQARQQKQLAELYALGLAHFQAGRWCESFESFDKLQAQAPGYRDVAELWRKSDEECRRSQVGNLEETAQKALEAEDWATATATLQNLLSIDPLRYEAREMLQRAQEKQAIAELYGAGEEDFRQKRFEAALQKWREVQSRAGRYKAVEEHLVEVQAQIALEQKKTEISDLYNEARAATERQNLTNAIEKYRIILALDPTQTEAEAKLQEVQHRQELVQLYIIGQQQFQASHWREALTALRPVQASLGAYEQVESLIAEAERHLEEEAASQLNYLDFDLAFEAVGSNYRANLLRSPAGTASVSFRLPFTPADLDGLAVALHQGGSQAANLCKNFGWHLFNTVFTGPLAAALNNSLTAADSKELNLRLRLNLSQTPELADLPWEYLFNPSFNSYLAQLERVWLLRHGEFGPRRARLWLKPPLRGLVVLAESPNQAEADWARLQSGLDKLLGGDLIRLDYLREASLERLQQQLLVEKYHVLHFIGQAQFEAVTGESRLQLFDKAGQYQATSSVELAEILNKQDGLRLVLLQASREAAASRTDPLGEVALGLASRGMPGVLNLPFPANPEATTYFLSAFYDALMQGRHLDEATSSARQSTYNKGYDIEWGGVRLYLGAADGVAFEVEGLSKEHQAEAFYRQAQAATAAEDWDKAISWLEQVVTLQVGPKDAPIKLAEARQQRELAGLYATALKQYQSGDWCAATESFNQLQVRAENYKDVAKLAAISADNCRKAQVEMLLKEAQAATAREDWATAQLRLEKALELDPSLQNAGALEQLNYTREQAKLATLYNDGLKYREAQRWPEALMAFRAALNGNPPYRQKLELLIEEAEEKLAEAERLEQATTIKVDLNAALAQEDWVKAAIRLGQLKELGPGQADAAQELGRKFQEQQEVARLYEVGYAAYQSGQTVEALNNLYKLRALVGPYKNSEELIAELEARPSQHPTTPPLVKQIYAPPPEPEPEPKPFEEQTTPLPLPPFQTFAPGEPLAISPSPANSPEPPSPPPGAWISTPDYSYPAPATPSNYGYPTPSSAEYGYPAPQQNPNYYPPQQNANYYPEAAYYPAQPPGYSVSAPPPLQTTATPRPTTPVKPAKAARKREPVPLIVRVLWFILIGWWLGLIWGAVGFLLCLTVLLLNTGVRILSYLPSVMTLLSLYDLRGYLTEIAAPTSTVKVPQRNPLLRIVYFLFIGWWAGGFWGLLGYFMSIFDSNTLTALEIFNVLPQVMTLRRSYDETNLQAQFQPTGEDKRATNWLMILLLVWALIPVTILIVVLLKVFIIK